MEKESGSLFVNDGSFMEKFKKLQQQQQQPNSPNPSSIKPNLAFPSKPPPTPTFNSKTSDQCKSATTTGSSTGKLAFSLKQKSKLAAAWVKLGGDEDEGGLETLIGDGPAKRQKFGQLDASADPFSERQPLGDVAPAPPSDPTVKNVADRLANFVAKNGRQIEHVTRQRNPGDTPFKFLFDISSSDYKYYEYRLLEEEKVLSLTRDSRPFCSGSSSISSRSSGGPQRNNSNYQIPASAGYESDEDTGSPITYSQGAPMGRNSNGELSGPSAADPIAMMEFYMKKAAQEERRRQPRQSKDEMPPPASLQVIKGHHMGDYIPQEELEKFLASCSDAAAQKAAKETAERSRIQADNVGHKLLSKMGWKEGEGLGSSTRGRADPIMAGNVKADHLGVGAESPSEVTAEDDIYEQYKKRMMLGYRYRPNPLGNPRKSYY